MKKMIPAIVVFALLSLSSREGWSLPPCPYSPTTYYWVYKNWTHCEGTIAYSDGDKYIGGWKGGYYHGQGTYTYADGSKYVGEFKNEKFHGQGTKTYTDGRKYVGEYKNGARHGRGKETLTDGKELIGEFKDGFYYGSYAGELKDGYYHGQGTFTFHGKVTADDKNYGRDYVGEWKDGYYHGQGRYRGNFNYLGEWKNNRFHGHGTLVSNFIYTGEWRNGKKHGQGSFKSNNRDEFKYVGHFQNDKFHGTGQLHGKSRDSSDRFSFSGVFRHGNWYHGRGTYTFTDVVYGCPHCTVTHETVEYVYSGEWNNGNFNGQGRCFKKTNLGVGPTFDGLWERGLPQTPAVTDFARNCVKTLTSGARRIDLGSGSSRKPMTVLSPPRPSWKFW